MMRLLVFFNQKCGLNGDEDKCLAGTSLITQIHSHVSFKDKIFLTQGFYYRRRIHPGPAEVPCSGWVHQFLVR
jgi:hypothetical protein